MIPDRIIERAVELWCRALRRPEFDNGDESPRGDLASLMAGLKAEKDTPNDVDARIEMFRVELTRRLKSFRDRDRKKDEGGNMVHFPGYLATDYGPGQILADAANAVALPLSLFPWKSTVYLSEDGVEVS